VSHAEFQEFASITQFNNNWK